MNNIFSITLPALFLIISTQTLIFAQEKIFATRLDSNPIIKGEMLLGNDGENINGPSLIKVPDFITNPLGKYYLYFSHHSGKYIRLAYSENLEGPWKIYEKGSLQMSDCECTDIVNGPPNHIASPDVHIDYINKKIVMYYHCPVHLEEKELEQFAQVQVTMRSTSQDGIHFISENIKLGDSYFRVFKWNNYYYAIARLGEIYRSKDGITNFEKGGNPFLKIQNPSMVRHSAVLLRDSSLYVFYSRLGDMPERILMSKIPLIDDWNSWTPSEPMTVLEPALDYEGVNLPLAKSLNGASKNPVRELRDPAIFEDNGKIFLLYSIAGELGIAIAELKFNK